jgi:hypothetical protein
MRFWRLVFPHGGGIWGVVLCGLIGLFCVAAGSGQNVAQGSLPFEVSNPKHLKWPVAEAGRIYVSACELVARAVRPERPPRLQPKFVLVLGAGANQIVRNDGNSEIHLTKWDPGQFAEAMVVLTTREVVKNEDVRELARSALIAAEATVSVSELKEKR